MKGEVTAEEHVRRCRPGAEAGDPRAMTGLGWALLQLGQDAEAELWYSRAADAGEPAAMTGLGVVLHRKGAHEQAMAWWRRAAAAGDTQAMRNLAATLRGSDRAEAERWGWFADAAERDVENETVPDEVAQAAVGLGLLRSAISRIGSQSDTALLIVGLVVAALPAGGGLFVITSDPAGVWGVGFVVIGAIIALVTVRLVVRNRDSVPSRVWRFEHGLVHRDVNGRLGVMRWTDVRVLRDITREYRNGHYVRTTFQYTLQHSDGHKLVLDDLVFPKGELCVLGEAIEREIAAVRLPRALAALQEGKRLEFGDLAVDMVGISDGGSHLPWTEVEAIDTTGGQVRVKRAGGWLNWSKTPVRVIPDVMVLLVLADALRAAAGARP